MIFRAILLVSLGAVCVVCVPAVNMSVQLQQNVSLPCDSHSNSSDVLAWFRLGSGDNMTVLVSASRGVLQRGVFIVEHNEERFELQAGGRLESVSLRIFSVRDEDIGLYFCSTGTSLKNLRFGTAVRLTLTDAASDVGCSALWIGVCVCAACVCCGFLSACVLCLRKDSSVLSVISCVNSQVQAAPVQYSSLRFIQRSRTPAPAPVDVTYATISKHTP